MDLERLTRRIVLKGRPVLNNAFLRASHRERMVLKQVTRDMAMLQAVNMRLGPLRTPVTVEAIAVYCDGTGARDGDAIGLAVKHSVDGLVAAGWLPDDSGEYITAWTFYAPHIDRELTAHELRIGLTEVAA